MAIKAYDATTDAELDALIEEGRRAPKTAVALGAKYLADTDQVAVTFDNGFEIRVPRSYFRQLKDASVEQMSQVEVVDGEGLSWPEFDLDYFVPNILDGFGVSDRPALAAYPAGVRDALSRRSVV